MIEPGEGIDAVLDREQARYEAELEDGWDAEDERAAWAAADELEELRAKYAGPPEGPDDDVALYCEVADCPARAVDQCCMCDGHFCLEHMEPRRPGALAHGEGCDRAWWAERLVDERVDDALVAEAAAVAHRTGGGSRGG